MLGTFPWHRSIPFGRMNPFKVHINMGIHVLKGKIDIKYLKIGFVLSNTILKTTTSMM
jgi:hypothetical protein